MKLDILYFASLRETLGVDREQLQTDDSIKTLRDLMFRLSERGDNWRSVMLENPNILTAMNREAVDRDTGLVEGAEVAFYPPVTGG